MTKNIYFIKLIYDLRELVTHREMLSKSSFENSIEKWKANFITVDTNIVDLITQCGGLLPNISDDCSIRLAHLWNLSLNEDTAFHPLRLSNYNVMVRGLYA